MFVFDIFVYAVTQYTHNVILTLIRRRPKRYGRCKDVETTLCVRTGIQLYWY